MARSYANLLDLAAGNEPLFTRPMQPQHRSSNNSSSSRGSMIRSATASGALSEGDQAGAGRDDGNSVASDTPSSVAQERLIVVANMLPLHAERDDLTQTWKFRWDEDALLLQMRQGIMGLPEREDMEIIYIGSLKVEVAPSEQDRVAAHLLDKFNCVPTFLSSDLLARFYQGFCKQQLWPLFHYMLPLSAQRGGVFDRDLWQAYVQANKIFSDKVMEVISPEDDYVWVHDYHLMVLPTFLRKKFNRVRLGFFLHSPFPSSEIYRALPVREEILRALLNADLIGFHTFDYARHFLSCCSRMLGLEYESRRGYIGLDYYGRTVGIKIMPVGVDMGRLSSSLRLSDTEWRLGELKAEYAGKTVILGVDDMDIFKGLGLKLQAFEEMLRQHPEWVGRAVLVQITNPARGKGRDVMETQEEVHTLVKKINQEFGREGYEPVVLYQRHVPLYERIAFYVLADCLVVTAVRDGMNLTPYEYIVCRQGVQHPAGRPPVAQSLSSRLKAAAQIGGSAGETDGKGGTSRKEEEERQQQAQGQHEEQEQSAEQRESLQGSAQEQEGSGHAPGQEDSLTPSSSSSSSLAAAAKGSQDAPAISLTSPGGPTASSSSPSSSLLVAAFPNLPPLNMGRGKDAASKKRSVIIVSEFIGCSPSLSGAIRVNPWNVQAVADAMNSALTMPVAEQQLRHEKHFKYVKDHNVGYWAQSFLTDLQRTCREHTRLRCYGIGFGLGFRAVALDPNFRKLQPDLVARAYQQAALRLLILDYDGTVMPQGTINKTPAAEVVQVINRLCSDPRNVVFAISGRTRATLSEWFASCPRLGLAAEHGYFFRLNPTLPWHTIRVPQSTSSGGAGAEEAMLWKESALPVLEAYTESTDGSYVEQKESSLVWHHQDADPDFGAWQAKELLDHLESVLANEPVTVRSGHHMVEVKPQGVSKGLVLDQLLELIRSSPVGSAATGGAAAAAAPEEPGRKAQSTPDFVLCVGDDRSDEDLFEKLEAIFSGARGEGSGGSPSVGRSNVFACTVGQKPSKAKYYLDDSAEVLKLLRILADSGPGGSPAGALRAGPLLPPVPHAPNGLTANLQAPPPVPAPDLAAGLLPSSLAAVLPTSTLQVVARPPPRQDTSSDHGSTAAESDKADEGSA